MHLWCHHDQAKEGIDLLRIPDISMIEHGGSVQDDFKNQNRHRRTTDQDDDDHLDAHGKEDLYRMEADPSGHIDIHIGMVHHVEPPEQGRRMKHDMLKVDSKIKE